MIVHRKSASLEHRIFRDLPNYLESGDCLVVNETRVIPARLFGHKLKTGGLVEILLLSEVSKDRWEALVKPGRRVREGTKIIFAGGKLIGCIERRLPHGSRIINFKYEGKFEDVLNEIGELPLPPYIEKPLKEKERYQTVYAKVSGSVAAPTAGLHFTESLINRVKNQGIKFVPVTLRIGLDTFRPVREEEVERHPIHQEYFQLTRDSAEEINQVKQAGKKVIAVGTTSARVLESTAIDGKVRPAKGMTDLFIYPGYNFKVVDALLTNFHLPRSTLLMMVCAFGGRELILRAYAEAISLGYRFYSFGDAMLIL
jgi:S-adenosylmethionine:tRNA ribosyltransferase-isomerase